MAQRATRQAAAASEASAAKSRRAPSPSATAGQKQVTYPVRDDVKVGLRLRGLRQARGLSIEQVAQAVGVTKSFISRLERDSVQASVATLLRVCDAIGVRAGTLFDPPPTSLVKHGEGAPIDLGGQKMREYIISGDAQEELIALRSEIEPGGGSGDEPYTLRSLADLVHVLEGELEMTIDGTTYLMKPGDTLTFPPNLPHTWRNPSRTERTRAIWVIVPPP